MGCEGRLSENLLGTLKVTSTADEALAFEDAGDALDEVLKIEKSFACSWQCQLAPRTGWRAVRTRAEWREEHLSSLEE